jgi:hypothetical protein
MDAVTLLLNAWWGGEGGAIADDQNDIWIVNQRICCTELDVQSY